MRTNFRQDQLADPHLRASEASLRACVHCGFCTATCPTYVLLGDERDSPRGRIALIQNMLETGAAPTPETVLHIDRCLSCLGCRTTCPSNVDYSVLVDTARVHIENHYRRPFAERAYRASVLLVLTRPKLFSPALTLGRIAAPLARLLPGKLGALAKKIPARKILNAEQKRSAPVPQSPKRSIALLPGCVQRALAPEIDLAAARVLASQGDAAKALSQSGCCGALAFHMGKADEAKALARAMMRAVEQGAANADAILNTASGCAAFLKEYPKLFLGEPEESRAIEFAAKVRDFSELVEPDALRSVRGGLRVAYHPPCSLQHGQKLKGQAEAALRSLGFTLMPFAEEHLCCGSAGSYSLLQPEISGELRARKRAAINASGAQIIVSGNIGCLTQLSGIETESLPALHLAELLDHATGGATPETLKTLAP